jgi:hypothetical protein
VRKILSLYSVWISFFTSLIIFPFFTYAQTLDGKEERFAKAAAELLKLEKMRRIARFEFHNADVASLCIAVHVDYVLFYER